MAKALLQELWLLKLDWDKVAHESVLQRWAAWIVDLPLITAHPISRRYFSSNAKTISLSLHGYSDASELAYGAVV